tara:strand:+ start:1370 stop:1612 length:243 start_codon:yes stop_codon:yes gene_type:complete
MKENELFGEAHEQEENGLFGRRHEAELCFLHSVTNRYLFFYEGEEDGWTFEIEAKDYEEAFDLAYDTHGPQVETMMYRQI